MTGHRKPPVSQSDAEAGMPPAAGSRGAPPTTDRPDVEGVAAAVGEGAIETALPEAAEIGAAGAGEGQAGPTPSLAQDAEGRAADYLDQLQRLKAEFDNYRKRTAKEREEWFLVAQADLAEALLPVLDDLRRAREHEAAGDAAGPEGGRLILKRFEDTLERLGLERQDAEPGHPFDPEQHDAVMTESSEEIPEGAILRILEPGYLFRGRLLRRSRICYSTGPSGG